MTFWHTISTAAASVPGIGSLVTLLQRHCGPDAGPHSPVSTVKFAMAIIALSAKLAKSDGAVTRDEVEMFRRIMDVPPGEEGNVRRLFELAKQDVAGFEAYAEQIGRLLANERALTRDVLDGLFAIAAADGVLHEREDEYLKRVSGHLGLTDAAYAHVRSLYFAAPMGPYEILGLAPAASDHDVKARQRQLIREHHPDRLQGMGCAKEHVARAERKLAHINAAFDIIAAERGL